ncbi:MAG: efflux RND transporter periplasmic adaptor subunit [Patescibacteria group bacterium]
MKKRRKIKIMIFIIIAIAIIFSLSFFFNKENVEYVSADLQRQNLKQTVNEVGAVKANKELNLNFLGAGRLNSLLVEVGGQVEAGQVLAELDYSSLDIKKQEILSSLNIAQTNKEKLLRGASYDEIRILETQVSQSKNSYESAKIDLEQSQRLVTESIDQAEKNLRDLKATNSEVPMSIKQAVDSARTNLDNTKRTSQQGIDNALSSLNNSLDYNLSIGKAALNSVERVKNDSSIKDVFSAKDFSYKTRLDNSYDKSLSMISQLDRDIEYFKNNYSSDLAKITADKLSEFLSHVFTTLDDCSRALEATILSSEFNQASLDNFKSINNSQKTLVNSSMSSNLNSYLALSNAILSYSTNVSSAQDAVSRAEINLSDAILSAENSLNLLRINSEQQISSANSRLETAKKSYEIYQLQLEKLKSPARSEDVRLAQSQIDQANSALESIDKQIEENVLKAPIDGKIVKINYAVGEQVLGNVPFIVILTENDFEVELLVSESDISKIRVGNKTNITFDAFSSDTFIEGEVYFIEPAATSIFDVIYYKTKIIFSAEDLISKGLEVKSGMTANVIITANEKDNIFAVPSRSIMSDDEGEYVRVLDDKSFYKVYVQVGMVGDQAMSEIISDELKEGDQIVISIREKK